jgi:hypothetical protein
MLVNIMAILLLNTMYVGYFHVETNEAKNSPNLVSQGEGRERN